MSEQFIIENTSFEQDLNAEISEDSFEAKRKGAIRNSRKKGTAKAITRAKRTAKRAQARARKAVKHVGVVRRRFRQGDLD